MIEDFDEKDRHVIPNWRSFDNTAKLGELNGSKGLILNSSFKPDISDLLDDWEDSKTIGVATDVISAALVSNQSNDQKVRDIAAYLLENRHLVTSAVEEAAKEILRPKSEAIDLHFDINTAEEIKDQASLIGIYAKIQNLKSDLIRNPYNAISWIEIARFYSVLGQDGKASRSVRNALSLSKNNRFILRSSARYFVHKGDFDLAHDIIRTAEITKHDPWMMATEIALASLRGRRSVFTKIGIQMVNSDTFHPFNITELASSVGTEEVNSSNRKSGRKLLEKSLQNPNDNSLAQAQWINNEEKILNISSESFSIANPFEAMAIKYNEQKKWSAAIDSSKKWFMDLPFSKRSIVFGNDIALRKLKDHDQAIEIAKLGLVSHPNDAHLLNNIVYSLCLQNKVTEAVKYLDEIPKHEFNALTPTGFCLLATKGLFYFRSRVPELGRKYYKEALKLTVELDDPYLNSNALINYIREEILCGEQNVSEILPRLHKIIDHYGPDATITDEANDVLELYRKRN